MTTLRALAKAPWLVRDERPQIQFSAGPWVGHLDTTDDTLAPAGPITDRKIPRTGAIAAIAMHASLRLKLEWTTTKTQATASRAGKIVATIDATEGKTDPYRIRMTADARSPVLHLAVVHGITLLRQEAARPAQRRHGRK